MPNFEVPPTTRGSFPVHKKLGSGLYSTDVANGQTVAPFGTFDTDGYAQIVGSCKSDRALTLRVWQGPDANSWAVKDDIAIAGDAQAGAGTRFAVKLCSNKARLELINASGADTADLQLYSYLSSGPGW